MHAKDNVGGGEGRRAGALAGVVYKRGEEIGNGSHGCCILMENIFTQLSIETS